MFWHSRKLYVKQMKEFVELAGFETRNKYQIQDETGKAVGWCAEQSKSVLGFIVRQFVGHWRSFELFFFDSAKNVVFSAKHPFRFYFQRLEVNKPDGKYCGALQRRFSILTKSFDLLDANEAVVATVRSPIWRLWTFPFIRNDREIAIVRKRWGGMLKEAFLDADNFELEVIDSNLPEELRIVLVASAIYIDLEYFEKKAQ